MQQIAREFKANGGSIPVGVTSIWKSLSESDKLTASYAEPISLWLSLSEAVWYRLPASDPLPLEFLIWSSEVQLAGMSDEYFAEIALLSVTLLAKGADVGAAATFVVDILPQSQLLATLPLFAMTFASAPKLNARGKVCAFVDKGTDCRTAAEGLHARVTRARDNAQVWARTFQ